MIYYANSMYENCSGKYTSTMSKFHHFSHHHRPYVENKLFRDQDFLT